MTSQLIEENKIPEFGTQRVMNHLFFQIGTLLNLAQIIYTLTSMESFIIVCIVAGYLSF